MQDLTENMEKPVIRKTGTTTVALVCKDAIVLAADKKATMGYLVASKETQKILPLADHIAMTIAGAMGDGQTLARYMRAEFKIFEIQNQRRIPIRSAASLMSNILQGSKFYPYFVQIMLGGIDNTGPSIFSLDALGSYEEEKKFFSTGSGSPFALGVLEDSYKEGMSAEEGSKLAFKAIRAAIERDIGSGGRAIDVVVITKDGMKTTRHDLK
jgi:proteasome beta subunit